MSLILACDLGGTSFRAALIDAAGATLAESILPGPGSRDENGRSEIDPEACVRCGICVSACPVGERALSFPGGDRRRPPEYDYRNCIRCYCCQELCPHRAIAVRTPFLGRLIAGK